jgi:transposase
MVLLETRQAAAALKVQRNKTDKNDARGLAHLVRSGLFRPVHVKSEESHRLRLLLTHRRTLKLSFSTSNMRSVIRSRSSVSCSDRGCSEDHS